MASSQTKIANVLYRVATASDYEGVLDIDRNIYGGNDYIPSLYHKYVDDPRFLCVVADVNGRIVGFEVFGIIDDGESLVGMALRINVHFRGLGLKDGIESFGIARILERYPKMKRILGTTINRKLVEKTSKQPNPTLKVLLQRPLISRLVSAKDLPNSLTASLVSKMSRDFPLNQVHHMTSSSALETLIERIDQRKFVPNDMWIVNSEPYGVCASNYKMILEDSTCFTTYAPRASPRDCIALSFGTGTAVPLGFRYRIDFYSNCDMPDVDLAIAHVWKHLVYINQLKKSGKISIGVSSPSDIFKVAMDRFFDEELWMKTSDVYVGDIFAVELTAVPQSRL